MSERCEYGDLSRRYAEDVACIGENAGSPVVANTFVVPELAIGVPPLSVAGDFDT